MSFFQGRKKWRLLPYTVSMCELVECFATRQQNPFFAFANHIMYVVVAKASEFRPHHLYNCILPHEKKMVLAPTPTPTSVSLPLPPNLFNMEWPSLGFRGFPCSHLFIKFWFHYEIVVNYYWFPLQNILWRNRTHVRPWGHAGMPL